LSRPDCLSVHSAFYSGVKRPESETDRSPSSAELRRRQTSPVALLTPWWCGEKHRTVLYHNPSPSAVLPSPGLNIRG